MGGRRGGEGGEDGWPRATGPVAPCPGTRPRATGLGLGPGPLAPGLGPRPGPRAGAPGASRKPFQDNINVQQDPDDDIIINHEPEQPEPEDHDEPLDDTFPLVLELWMLTTDNLGNLLHQGSRDATICSDKSGSATAVPVCLRSPI